MRVMPFMCQDGATDEGHAALAMVALIIRLMLRLRLRPRYRLRRKLRRRSKNPSVALIVTLTLISVRKSIIPFYRSPTPDA